MNFEMVVFASLIWKRAVSFTTTVWRSVQTSCVYLCTHHISTSSVLQELSLHVQMCPFHSAKSLTGLFRLWPWGSSPELETKQAEQDGEDGDVFNPFVWPTTGNSGGDFSRCLFTTDFLKEFCGIVDSQWFIWKTDSFWNDLLWFRSFLLLICHEEFLISRYLWRICIYESQIRLHRMSNFFIITAWSLVVDFLC